LRKESQLEIEELNLKLNNEVKQRLGLENAKRDLYDQMEEHKKNLRAESNVVSELKESNHLLMLEVSEQKRTVAKLNEAKQDAEVKQRKIQELVESNRTSQQRHQEEIQKADKKYELLRMKMEMEVKMKEDMA